MEEAVTRNLEFDKVSERVERCHPPVRRIERERVGEVERAPGVEHQVWRTHRARIADRPDEFNWNRPKDRAAWPFSNRRGPDSRPQSSPRSRAR